MLRVGGVDEMTALAEGWRREGLRIGFVPTMGFLHEGHVSLMRRAAELADRVVVSVYVNPLQFGPNEDLSRYPRDPEGDAAKCEAAGVHALFMPADLYPSGFSTAVTVDRLTTRLDGVHRPGHFDGVATVVARLFGVVRADLAVFGEKDWQQLQVVRRMVRDLALPVTIVPGELIRDPYGLAMSSRNSYLAADERRRALSLSRALRAMASAPEADPEKLVAIGRRELDVDSLDYLEVVDGETLEPVERVYRGCRALIAARIGKTRLIDNLAVG